MTDSDHKEGIIKYQSHWAKLSATMPEAFYLGLNKWRDRLFQLKLIGAYPDGIGFGNLSVRIPYSQEFWISGSKTGTLKTLSKEHYSRVTDFDIDNNRLWNWGAYQASSESMSHAVLYRCDRKIQSVIHIHHKKLWEELLNRVPTTDSSIAYGTPEMAYAIHDLFNSSNLPELKILVMGGHEEGIITFGASIDEAGHRLLSLYETLS